MPQADSSEGRFVWYDCMTPDPDAAIAFYTELIGWGTQPWDGPMPYTMWTAGDTPIGGVMQLPEEAQKAGAPPHWLGYVSTSDVDASLSQAQGLGARVLVPATEIPNTGKFAVMADPQGATVAIYSSVNELPAPDPEQVGLVSWNELATTDLEAAWGFYTSMFGWSKTEDMDMGGEAGIYRMYGKGNGAPLGGIFTKTPEWPVSAWSFYIRVPDVDAAAEKVKEMGGKILNGPMEVPGGDRIVQCMDPQGGAFAMHSSKR